MKKPSPLPRRFYDRATLFVAQALLGKIIIHKIGRKIIAGVIVETEAYTSNDPACHAARGRTPRNAVMFGKPGHAYVYFVYGNHFCLNAVTESHGKPGAVLIRALEPVAGINSMRTYRRRRDEINLTNGPGKLCQALGISKAENGCDLTKGSLIIAECNFPKVKVVRARRIGITQGTEKLWRFYVKDNKFVSRIKT